MTADRLPLLIDTDPGVDDALAILMAHAQADVAGLAIAAGNVGLGHTVGNALKLVEVIGARTPVFPGCPTPLVLPAARWTLGLADGGFALDVERGAEEVQVPEFEIDAQPVGWAQFVEFIDDSGYDRQELWHPAGWAWLQREAAGEGRKQRALARGE